MTIPAAPAVLKACPGCLHNRPPKDSSLCGPCKRALPAWLQEEVRRTWAAYLVSYGTALVALQAAL